MCHFKINQIQLYKIQYTFSHIHIIYFFLLHNMY